MPLKKLGDGACLVLLLISIVCTFQSSTLPSLEAGWTVKPEQNVFQRAMSNNWSKLPRIPYFNGSDLISFYI